MLYRGSKFLVLSCSLFLVGAIDAPSALSPGDTDTNSETPSQPLREIVQAPDNCPAEVCNPCCPPPCPPAWRFDLKGSFLYWYANQSGMAFTNKAQSTFTTSDFSNGTLVNPSYDWEPGLRVDAAYGFDRSYWYFGADVICYWGKGSGSQSTTSINGLFPALSFASDSLSSDYANSAKFKWTLTTTIFDLLAYYDWVYNSYFTLTPTFGVRNAWLTQNATAQYEGGTYQAEPDIVNLTSKF